MWVPLASKARTRPTLRGCPLLRRFRLQLRLCAPRQLCLGELLFDATAGSAATAPPVACGSALPSSGCGTCPALPPACGPTRPSLGCGSDPAPLPTRGLTLPLGSGSGLVSSSVPWDEFVPGLWEYVLPENEEEGVLEVIEKVPQNSEGQVPEGHVTNLAMLARLHGLEESEPHVLDL